MAKIGRPRGSFRPHPPTERELQMYVLYNEGNTLQAIGDIYGVTKERVRQLLLKYFNRTGKNCPFRFGRSVNIRLDKTAVYRDKEELKYTRWFGCSKDVAIAINGGEYKTTVRNYSSPAWRYLTQKRSARARGIEWKITLPEWWRIWQESGKWWHRGRGYSYVMGRYGDSGAYEAGNVYICTGAQNASDQYLVHRRPREIKHQMAASV